MGYGWESGIWWRSSLVDVLNDCSGDTALTLRGRELIDFYTPLVIILVMNGL